MKKTGLIVAVTGAFTLASGWSNRLRLAYEPEPGHHPGAVFRCRGSRESKRSTGIRFLLFHGSVTDCQYLCTAEPRTLGRRGDRT